MTRLLSDRASSVVDARLAQDLSISVSEIIAVAMFSMVASL